MTELKHLSKNCNFCDCLCDSLLRDKLVMGIVDKETRKKLLQMKKLTLELCIDTCRASKLLCHKLQLFLMQLLFIGLRPLNQNLHTKKQYKPNVTKCHLCGKQHDMLKSKCPVYGKTCRACNQKNHFSCSAKCHKKVNSVTNSNDDIHMINIVHSISDKAIFGKIIVNNKPVKIQIDSGASVNVLPEQYVSPADIQTTTTVLQMYNKSIVKPLGESKVKVYNPANGHTYSVKFVIVQKTLV